MPNIQDNKIKRANTINATADKTKQAELNKKTAVPDPAANAAQKSDAKTGKKNVNVSVGRAKTFTKLKTDSAKTVREIKNVKKAAPTQPVKKDEKQLDLRSSGSMFDLNEPVEEMSFSMEAEQEVKQGERISIEDKGLLEILNTDAIRPSDATLKKRKRKEVEDNIERYHNTLESAENVVFKGEALAKTKYATVGDFKKNKRIDKAIERGKYATVAEAYMNSGKADKVEYGNISDTKSLGNLINAFMRLSDNGYPLDTDENFIKNLEKNYQLTIEARKLQKYISDAADGGYMPKDIDLEAVQKRIAGYEELKSYLDIRSRIITSPYYIYCASQDVNYTDEQLKRFIDGFADKENAFKDRNKGVLDYLKYVQQLRQSKFVRKSGIKSLSGRTKSKAKHETKVLQTRKEKRDIVERMTGLDGDLKNRKRYGDDHYEKTFSKERLRNTIIDFEAMKLGDLHFADFADMADYGAVNAEIFDRVKAAEQILYVAAGKGELDGMDPARVMNIRAKLTAFKAAERLFESIRKVIVEHPEETVNKLTYDEIWENALNAIKEENKGDNTEYPKLGSDLDAYAKSIFKTYKKEAREAGGEISQVQALISAHMADDRAEEAGQKIAKKDRFESLFTDIEAGNIRMLIGDLKTITGPMTATFKEKKISVREREKLLSERGTDQFKKNRTAQTLKDNRKAYQNLTYEIKNKVSLENRIKIGDKTLDDLAALLNGNFLDSETREEDMNRFLALYADKAQREQNLDILTKYIIQLPMETPEDLRYPNAEALAQNAALFEAISSKAYAYRNLLKANPEYAEKLKKRFGGDRSDYSVITEKLNRMFAYSDYYRACRLLISDNYYILHGNDEIGAGRAKGLTGEARHTYDLLRLVDTCARRLIDREYEDRSEGGQLEKTLDLYEQMNVSQAYLTGRVDLKQASVSNVQDEQKQIKKFLRHACKRGDIRKELIDYDPAQNPEAEKYRTPAVDSYIELYKTHAFLQGGAVPIGKFDRLTPGQRELVAKLKKCITGKDGKQVTYLGFKDGLSKDKGVEWWDLRTNVSRLITDLAMGMSDLASDEELIDMVDGLVLTLRGDFKADDEASYKYARERFLRSAKKLFQLQHEQMKRYESTYGTMPSDCSLPIFMHSLGSGMQDLLFRGRFSQTLTELGDEKGSTYNGGKVDLGRILVLEGMITEEEYQDVQKKHVEYYQQVTGTVGSYAAGADTIFDIEGEHEDPATVLDVNLRDYCFLENSAQKNNIGGPHLGYSQKRKLWKDSLSSKDKKIYGGSNSEKFYSDMFNFYSTSELKRIRKRRQKDHEMGQKTYEYLNKRRDTLLQDSLRHMKELGIAFGFNEDQKAQIKKLMVFHPGMSRDYWEEAEADELKEFYTNVMAFLGFGVQKEQLKESKLKAFEYFCEKAGKMSQSVTGDDPEDIMSANNVRTAKQPVLSSKLMKMENCHQMYDVLQDMAADRKELNWFDAKTRDELKAGIFKNLRLECIRAVMMSDYYLNVKDITARYETKVGRNFLALKALGMAKTVFTRTNNLDRTVLADKELTGFMKECGIRIDSFADEEEEVKAEEELRKEEEVKEPVARNLADYSEENKAYYEALLKEKRFPVPKDMIDLVAIRNDHMELKYFEKLNSKGELYMAGDYFWKEDTDPVFKEAYDWLVEYYRAHIDNFKETDPVPYNPQATAPLKGEHTPYEYQGNTLYCWACTMNGLMNEYAGHKVSDLNMVKNTPLNIPSFAESGFADRNKYNEGVRLANRMHNGNETGNPAIFGDYILNILPNTAVCSAHVGIAPDRREFCKRRFLETLGTRLEKGPVGLLHAGHFVLVYGIDGDRLKVRNSASANPDELREHYYTAEDIFNSNAREVELVWLEDIRGKEQEIAGDFNLDYNEQNRTFSGAVNREKETILHKNGVEGIKAAADGDLVSYQIYVPKQLVGEAAGDEQQEAGNVQQQEAGNVQQQEVREEGLIYTAVAGATITREEQEADKEEQKSEEKKENKTEKKADKKVEKKAEKKADKKLNEKVSAYIDAAGEVLDFYLTNLENPSPELEAFTGNIVALGEYLKDKCKDEDASLLEGEIVQLKKLYDQSSISSTNYLNALKDSKSGELKALKDGFQNKVKVISEMLEKDRKGIDQANAAKGLSLKQLLNDIRTEPFATQNAEINEYVGGNINQRLHIKKEGQEFAFTETKEVLLVENVMNRAIEKYPVAEAVFAKLKSNPRARQIIPTLVTMSQDDFIAYKEGKATAENIERIKAHFTQLNSTVSIKLDVDKLMADEAFLKSYYDVMSELKAALNAEAGNEIAAIKKGRSIEKRNVAMTRVAELMGMSSLVAHTKTASIIHEGEKKTGVIMEWVNGMTSEQINKSKDPIDCSGSKNVLQQLADIEALDFICGNVDRHMGNLIFTVENNRIVSLKGVDNDSSFGNLKGLPGEYTQYMTVPKDILLMRQQTATMILSLQKEELRVALGELIAEDEIDDLWSRVEVLKAHIKQSAKEKPENGKLRSGFTRILGDHDSMWDKVDIPTLASVCNSVNNNSIYKRMANEFKPAKAVEGIPFMANVDEYEAIGTESVKDAFVNTKIPKNGQFTEAQLRAGANFKPEVINAKSRFDSELYKKMGIKDITDCIYVGGEKLKDYLQKKYGFKYEYGDQDKLKCFRAYMSAFAANSTLTMTYVHPQIAKSGQAEIVVCDLDFTFENETAEMKTKKEELISEARQTRNERHTSIINALYPYTQYKKANLTLKKTDIQKGAYRRNNQTYRIESCGEPVETDVKCEYIFATDTKKLPAEAKRHLAGNTLMNYCGLGGQITEVKPAYATDEEGNVHYGVRIASGYTKDSDVTLPALEDLCRQGREAGQPIRIEYTADAIRQLTGIRLMLSLFGDTGVDPVNDLSCVVHNMDRKDGYVVFVSGFYLNKLSKPFGKSITGKDLKKNHKELKALDLKSLPAIDKEVADSILSLDKDKLKSLVGDMLGEAELEAMNSRLEFIKAAINDEMAEDIKRPENEKRILSGDKWQKQWAIDRLQSELRKNPDSIFEFGLEGMQTHIEGSRNKKEDEIPQPQWEKTYRKMYGNLMKAIKSAKSASEFMEIITSASFALASNAFGQTGTLEHDLMDAVLERIYNELMTKELAETYVAEKFASFKEIINSVAAKVEEIDLVPKEFRNEKAIKGKIDSKVKRAKEKAKADNKPFDEEAERQKATAEVENKLKEQYAITLLVKEKPSLFLKQDKVKQFMQNISPISFTNKTLNMEFAGSVVPVVNDYADALAKTLPGGQKEYKAICSHGDSLVPIMGNFDLITVEKRREALATYDDAIAAETKSFAKTVIGLDKV